MVSAVALKAPTMIRSTSQGCSASQAITRNLPPHSMIKTFKLFSFKPTLLGGLFLTVTALAEAQQPDATTPAQLKQSPMDSELQSDPNLRNFGGQVDTVRERSFDRDWQFFRGEATGAEAPSFDDSGWRSLAVPHDWSIEDLPNA